MDMKTRLSDALKESLRAGDEVRKRTIRMVLAAIQQTEIDRQIILDETAVLSILQKEIKSRRESLEEAKQAGREDLVQDAQAEIDVLKSFLPAGLSADELRAMVQAAIAETGSSSPTDMGKVMKALLPKVAGRAPGDQVSAVVREILQK